MKCFFQEIIIDGPLGKVKYAVSLGFHFRGSPHIHSFLYVIYAPVLTKDMKKAYLTYIDHIIKAQLPDIDEEPELNKLLKTYQIHSHSKYCKKYKNISCRYSFGRYFTNKTIIANAFSEELSGNEKVTSSFR